MFYVLVCHGRFTACSPAGDRSVGRDFRIERINQRVPFQPAPTCRKGVSSRLLEVARFVIRCLDFQEYPSYTCEHCLQTTMGFPIIPKDTNDKIAAAIMWFAVHLICLFELFVVLPSAHEDKPFEFAKHVIFGLYIYVNVMISLVMVIRCNSSTKNMMLPSVLKPGWRFCAPCETNSPPRSFHCWNCDICVLRRDHHCIFTGNCIGLHNHRHFLTFSVYLMIGAFYCNYLNMEMVYEMVSGFSMTSLLTMIVPCLAWVLGLVKGYTFGVAIISSTCILGNILLVALLVYHMNNLINGQVTHEASHQIKEYNVGWKENFRQVFGENWRYAWLNSLIRSPLPCDGTQYPQRYKYEDVKAM